MKILSHDEILDTCSVVTIGSYDGVHYGHRQILNNLLEKANQYNATAVLLTLHPHPRKVLKLDISRLRLLNSLEEKTYLLEKCGLPALYIAKFDKEFSELSGEQFVKQYLVDRLKAKAVIIGYDHQFGKNRENGYEFLEKMGKKYGFDLYEIPKQDLDAEKISSTTTRKLIEQGDIEKANKYLCHPYMFIATIDSRGYLSITEPLKLIPPMGEYDAEISGANIENFSCKLLIDNQNRIKLNISTAPPAEYLIKIIGKR